jgi:hypothetical protein
MLDEKLTTKFIRQELTVPELIFKALKTRARELTTPKTKCLEQKAKRITYFKIPDHCKT